MIKVLVVDDSALARKLFTNVLAAEPDFEVQSARDEEEHRCREGEERDDVEHQRMTHERDVTLDAKELHQIPL